MKKFLAVPLTVLAVWGCARLPKTPVEWADPFIGTGGHGHTYPGASAPFGAVQLSPDTRRGNWDACSGYHHSDSVVYGFSHTHLSGTGCIDLGDVLFHPSTSKEILHGEEYIFQPHVFSHDDETASPGYYRVELPEAGIIAELTAAPHTGVHRYTYRKGAPMKLIIDLGHKLDDEESIDSLVLHRTAVDEISGMRRTQGWTPDQYVFFSARFSREILEADFIRGDNGEEKLPGSAPGQAVLDFGVSDGTPLVAKVGISIVSEENSRANMLGEVPDFDFDAVRRATLSDWEKVLSRVTVDGGTPEQMKTFYTAAYHAMLAPNTVSDCNGEYRRQDMSIAVAPGGEDRFSTFSLWDAFRAWHPLMTLIDTAFVASMVRSMMDMGEASPGGDLPIWPLSAGETGTMPGYHSIPVIADAWLRGVRGFDPHKALDMMKLSSQINRKGSEQYIKYGYIPSDLRKESVSTHLEFAYDDWCIARMAEALGAREDCLTYTARAMSYSAIFDTESGFFRPKRLDGRWDGELRGCLDFGTEAIFAPESAIFSPVEGDAGVPAASEAGGKSADSGAESARVANSKQPLNPYAPDRAFTEATPWQYRFFVPHDMDGLIRLMGGREDFAAALDSLFTAESRIDGEMVDISGMIGQYAHGNEPSHHMAWLYNYAGQPWKTQAMTRRILSEMYSTAPDGISGNEDCGQMSAWYILSSLGLYPVCPGSGEFQTTSPLFPRATVKLANGRELRIVCNDPADNPYIRECLLNGEPVTKSFLTFDQLMEGGLLEFVLSPVPITDRALLP